MKRILVGLGALLPLLVLSLLTTPTGGQEPPKDKDKGGEKPAVKADPATINKLIEQLGSNDFKVREKASQQLAALDEVPEALAKATKHADAEIAGRAQKAVAVITARLEQKAFEELVRDLHKVELDKFVHRMVTDEKFAGEPQWKIIQTIAKAVIKETNKVGQRNFGVPDFDLTTMPRHLLNGNAKKLVGASKSAILCVGPTPYITGVTNSLVIVDGDFAGATHIGNSLLIVRGNIGRVTGVQNSIILATGHWVGATGCDDSFVQVNNYRIRFTVARNSTLIKTLFKTTGATNNQILNIDKGPLQLLKFSPRKTDAQLAWGKEVNNLTVAITPANQKDKFLVRWKNVGQEAMEIPWVRMNSSIIPFEKYQDDLLGHVFLKGPDGKLAPAQKHPAPPVGGPPSLLRSVILGPGQVLEETIDLWTYVERPAAAGQYQLSLELDLPMERKGWDWDGKSWSGKIQSNVLDVTVGK